MLDKLKTLFELKTATPASVADTSVQATKGMALNHFIRVDYPLLDLTPSLLFKLGRQTKKITGMSSTSERGEQTHRFYTDDDYFVQVDYFGDNLRENLSRLAIFSYLLDEGESIAPDDENTMTYWRKIIEDNETFTYKACEFQRVNSGVLGGLEVVELIGNEINTLENNFAVFSREVVTDFYEFLIINVEQEVIVDDDYNISQHGDMTVTMSLGVSIPHAQLSINPNQGQ